MRLLKIIFFLWAPLFAGCGTELSHSIDEIVQRVDSTVNVGVEVVSLRSGQRLYEKGADRLFLPSSDLQLFTAAASLAILGVDFQFETDLLIDDNSNLYLRGSGDPSLTRYDLEETVEQLKKQRLEEVVNIIVDASVFDAISSGPGWVLNASTSPLSGLSIDQESPRSTGEALVQLLRRSGIAMSGEVIEGNTPKEAKVVGKHCSCPLSQIVMHMMKNSDNFYADTLFKKMGEVCFGAPGTWQKGALAVRGFLKREIGLDTTQMVILDGSGLSLYNLVSPHQFVVFLARAKTQFPFVYELISSLPISGIDGTLKERMVAAKSKVRAKTASMKGVAGMSGYVEARGGDILAFSILLNGFIHSPSIEDEICLKLTQYFR